MVIGTTKPLILIIVEAKGNITFNPSDVVGSPADTGARGILLTTMRLKILTNSDGSSASYRIISISIVGVESP